MYEKWSSFKWNTSFKITGENKVKKESESCSLSALKADQIPGRNWESPGRFTKLSPSLISPPLPGARHQNDSPQQCKTPSVVTRALYFSLSWLVSSGEGPFRVNWNVCKYEQVSSLDQNHYCPWRWAWDIRALYEMQILHTGSNCVMP